MIEATEFGDIPLKGGLRDTITHAPYFSMVRTSFDCQQLDMCSQGLCQVPYCFLLQQLADPNFVLKKARSKVSEQLLALGESLTYETWKEDFA